MRPAFASILFDLQRLGESSMPPKLHGSDAHRFRINPPIPVDEVRDFEARHRIRLPEEYRDFIVHVGNGGAGPGYGLFPLGMENRGYDTLPWTEGDWLVGVLSEPFPHTEPWNDLTGKPVLDEELEEDPVWEAEFQERLRAWEEGYFSTANVNGAFPICHRGCALQDWLIVTGSQAGQVWADCRVDHRGLRPTNQSFLQWYRSWLDDVLAYS